MERMRQVEQQQQQPVRELTPAEAAKDDGNAAFKPGDWDGAVAAYTQALELDPQLTAARNNRAMALLKQGRWEEAEADSTAGGCSCRAGLHSVPGSLGMPCMAARPAACLPVSLALGGH